MPDIYDAVNFAIAQSGKPYRAYGDRFGPDYFDCSGLVIASLAAAGIPLGPGISVAGKTGNTVSLYNWAKGVGGLVPVSQGVATRGAIMIKGKWYGNGPLGHTSLSLGDGREMAAHGYRSGIHISTMDASYYQDAFIIPGVDYHIAPIVSPAEEAYLIGLDHWRHRIHHKPLRFGDQGPDVAFLIDRFVAHHFLKKGTKGDKFGVDLRTANVKFKDTIPELRDQPAPAKGENFGGDAADALVDLG